jgi:hypothetical protein
VTLLQWLAAAFCADFRTSDPHFLNTMKSVAAVNEIVCSVAQADWRRALLDFRLRAASSSAMSVHSAA